jgi:hypothetical protein
MDDAEATDRSFGTFTRRILFEAAAVLHATIKIIMMIWINVEFRKKNVRVFCF